MLNFNEGKACDAIVGRPEEREQHQRAGLRWPEREKHGFPVKIVLSLGDQI
jgi:hypothetical protein